MQSHELSTVFLIEDDPLVQKTLSSELVGHRLAVRSFGTAEALLAVHTVEMRGGLVVDVCLPGMDGVALIAALKDRATHLPSIAISGFVRTPIVVEAMRLGAVDFLEKPFPPHALREAVRVSILPRAGTSP